MEEEMLSDSQFASWMVSRRAKAVAIFAALLFTVHVGLVQALHSWRISESTTLLDDFVFAAFGGAALWFFLKLQAERQEFAHARERLLAAAQVNHRIRRALSVVVSSVVLQNEDDRLRLVDEAIERIDEVLLDMAPSPGDRDALRGFVEQTR
jgi:two-component sensor histidine kinase